MNLTVKPREPCFVFFRHRYTCYFLICFFPSRLGIEKIQSDCFSVVCSRPCGRIWKPKLSERTISCWRLGSLPSYMRKRWSAVLIMTKMGPQLVQYQTDVVQIFDSQLGTLPSEFQLSKQEKNDYDPSKDNLGRVGSWDALVYSICDFTVNSCRPG